MNKTIINRVLNEAGYILQTRKTIRETAKEFKVSKSTVHKDMQERLSVISKELAEKIRIILDEHLMVRHINGGNKTKEKYLNERDKNDSKTYNDIY